MSVKMSNNIKIYMVSYLHIYEMSCPGAPAVMDKKCPPRKRHALEDIPAALLQKMVNESLNAT